MFLLPPHPFSFAEKIAILRELLRDRVDQTIWTSLTYDFVPMERRMQHSSQSVPYIPTHLLAFCVGFLCLFTCLSHASASVRVQFDTLPRALSRGQTLQLKGKVIAPKSLRDAGLMLAIYLRTGKKRILLSQHTLPSSPEFQLSVLVPRRLPAKTYRLETTLLVPIIETKPTTSKQPPSKRGRQTNPTPGGSKGSKGSRQPGTQAGRSTKGRKGQPGSSGNGAAGRSIVDRLYKQLKRGWGPATDKKALSPFKQSKKNKKTKFILPPVQSKERPKQTTTPSKKTPPQKRSSGLLGGLMNMFRGSKTSGSKTPGSKTSRTKVPSRRKPGTAQGGKTNGQKTGTQGSVDRKKMKIEGGSTNGTGQGTKTIPGQGTKTSPGRGTKSRPGPGQSPVQPQEDPLQDARKDGVPLMLPPSKKTKKKSPYNHSGPKNKSSVLSRDKNAKLDAQTNGGDIYMRQVFEPYIPHHQRITVFDKINAGYRLALRDHRKRLISIGGQRSEARNYFRGRIRVWLQRDRWTPIPSVAPDARILWVRTRPQVRVQFAKDSADVMFVRPVRPMKREVFLEFGTDADKGYFGGALREGIHPHMYTFAARPRVSRRIRRVVFRNIKRAGIHSNMQLHEIMHKLVPYLRGFAVRKLKQEERKGDLYSTLFQARVGVCRHRATLFMVTMRALGYPARFVANGAHAFAEVMYNDGRWRVVDLGGGDIPNWEGKWRGKPFQPPRDPYKNPNKPKRASQDPPPKPEQIDDPNKPYIPSGGRTDNSAGSQWRYTSKPPVGGPSKKKRYSTKWVRKPTTNELMSAIKRLVRKNRKKKRSSYIIHAPLKR